MKHRKSPTWWLVQVASSKLKVEVPQKKWNKNITRIIRTKGIMFVKLSL